MLLSVTMLPISVPALASAGASGVCPTDAPTGGYRSPAKTDTAVPGDPSQVEPLAVSTMLGWPAPAAGSDVTSTADLPRQPGQEQQFFELVGVLSDLRLDADDAVRVSLLDLNNPSQSVSAEIPAGGDDTPFCAPRLELFGQLGIDPSGLQPDAQPAWSPDPAQPPVGVDVVGQALYDATPCSPDANPGACWTIDPVVRLTVMSADDLANAMNNSNPAPAPAGPPAGATMAVQFVASPGADPSAIVMHIAGPGAYAQRAALTGMNPPPSVAQRLLRTYLVPAAPGREQELLARTQADPGVENAQLVRWPPIIPM
jgi:hypothetical protein